MYETKQKLIDAYSENWEVEHITGDFYSIQGRTFIIKEVDNKFIFEPLE
jgi:hypothetical protein